MLSCTLYSVSTGERGKVKMGAMSTAAHKRESTQTPRATYQDVLEAPAHGVAEIVDGTLYTHPRPAMPHALASSRLGFDLGGPFDRARGGPGGWWIIDEPELHLGEDILVPDLAGWRRERMPDYPETAYVTLAPDWVCEVLSASTRRLEICMASARSMPAKASGICGSWARRTGPWRRSSSATASGC